MQLPKVPFTYDNVPVVLQDQITRPIDIRMFQDLNTITLANDFEVDSYTVVLEPGHGVQVGERVGFVRNNRLYAAQVLNVATNTLTLDSPGAYLFPAGSIGVRAIIDMNADGSVTPQVFRVNPPPGVTIDVTRMIISMVCLTAVDDSKFGDIAALANGLVLRTTLNGERYNIKNFKSNSDFAEMAYDVAYTDKAGGGKYGVRVRISFNGLDKHGVAIRLNGNIGQRLEMIIQDDLTGLDSFHTMVQGHFTTDVTLE